MKESIVRFEVRFKGVKPLLMANPQMANPLNHYKKEISKYTSKRNKTDEDHEEISRLQFLGHLYYDEKVGVYIPSEMIEASIVNGAKVTKNGKKIPLAVNVVEYKIPLIYKDIKTPDELFNDEDFVDVRFGVLNRSKILVTRPRFNQWEIVFNVDVDTSLLNVEEFVEAVNNAGQRAGIGTYRPKYGTYEAIIKQVK